MAAAVMARWDATEDGKPLERSRVATPSGYDSVNEFLAEMRQRYEEGVSADDHNVEAGKEDAKFVAGNQWDPVVEERRKRQKKPILTVNRLIAFIAQIVGNRLMNETEIRVNPDKAGTKAIATIREGIIRRIYKNSQAVFARDEAHKYQVIGGQGAFYLSIEYAGDDVFEQKICLKNIADPYAAVFDPMGVEPTGADCEWAFVGEDISNKAYKNTWPWAATVSFDSSEKWNQSGHWATMETVRIVSYWRMVTEGTKTLALFQDGTTHDVSDKEEFEYLHLVAQRSDGTPYTREVPNRFARLYIASGAALLEGPYDYPISSLPVYRVSGWEVNDGQRLHRWGLVRFLKDSQRLHNYWRSVLAEQLVAVPRNKWLTTPASIQGHEAKWRNSPTSDDPFLFYNDGEPAPVHIPPPGLDAALVNEAGMSTQDLKDISNIHEASLGMPSNEVSGKAIQQRQQVSDVGSYIYSDRLRMADERCAKNIDELIPHVYDTQRTLTIIGQDDKTLLQVINDPNDPDSDVTLGQYGVTVTVGPATSTKRALAAEQMMAFVNAIPEVASQVMDLVAEAQDWPKSDEFARRFRMQLAPGIISPDDMSPEEQQMAAQNQQIQQLQQQLQEAAAQADLSVKQQNAANLEARSNLAAAQAYKAIHDARARIMDVRSKMDERDFKKVMGTLDQHNDLIHEDRTFAADRHDTAHDHVTSLVDQHNALEQRDQEFAANLANTDRDFRLQELYHQHQQDADAANNGEQDDVAGT
jgi:hypothetical protein